MQILARPEFWLIILAVGLLNGSGMVKMTHLVALLAEQGRSIEQATLLLVLSGGAGVIGSMAFGWLGDKIGGALALTVNGLMQAGSWSILLFHVGLPLLSLDAAIMGVCGAGIFSAHVVLLTRLFGPQNLARSLSLIGMFAIALNFISPPVAGLLRDATGSYLPVLFTMIGACLVASTLLLVLRLRERARATSAFAIQAEPKTALGGNAT